MDADRESFGNRITAMRQVLHDPETIEAWTNTPGGLDRLHEMSNQLRLAQLFHEQDHHSPYTAEVAQMMSDVQEQIMSGQAHTDLTSLLGVRPRELLLKGLKSPSTGGKWTAQEAEELVHTGGYVPGGLYGRGPDDPAIQKYSNFNPVDYLSNMWMLEDEQFFSMVHHKKFQDEYLAMRMESMKDLGDALEPLEEFSNQDYDRMAPIAVDATYSAAAGFADQLARGTLDPTNLHKSLVLKDGDFAGQDIHEAMATKLMEDMFLAVGGRGSDVRLSNLNDLLRGEGENGIWDVDLELYKAFNARNILRHVDDQMLAMTQAPGEEGDPISLAIAKEIFDMPEGREKTQLLRAFTMSPGDVQRGYRLVGTKYRAGKLAPDMLGRIHEGVNRLFRRGKQKAQDLMNLIEMQPAFKGYVTQQGALGRYRDALVASWMSDKPGADATTRMEQEQAIRMASPEQQRAALLETEGMPPDFDLEYETLKEAVKLTPYMAMGKMVSGVTSSPEFLAALYSGDYSLAPVAIPPKESMNYGSLQAFHDRMFQAGEQRASRVQAEMKRRRDAREKQNQDEQPLPAQGPSPEEKKSKTQDEPNQPPTRG
jgi:hypothetical protein